MKTIKRTKLLLILLCTMLVPIVIFIKNNIVTAPYNIIQNASELSPYMEDLPKNTLILFDIDDTLITPVSQTFSSPYKKMIDEIKANKNKYTNYEEIISTWRLNRKIKLTDSNWPDVINRLKTRFLVLALTKMDTGPVGKISSTEEWRSQELESLGLLFSSKTPKLIQNQGSSFYKGVIFTGSCKKSEALQYHVKVSDFEHVVMIDDREEHLTDIKKLCETHNIPYTGICFSVPQINIQSDIPKLQYQYLTEKHTWLEDANAASLLRANYTENK